MAVEPTGFIGWLTNYGQIIAFFVQLAFYIALGIAAIWATLIFRRFVNAYTGEPSSKAEAATASADSAAVSVDEFVE